jgi:DNA adenine methylase
MNNVKLKPFIKYCGGKSRLLPYIFEYLPDMNTINNYFEPFVGGGSVFFELYLTDTNNNKDTNNNFNREYTISDINDNLINCYEIIKNNVEQLIIELEKDIYKNDKTNYYICRNRFNQIKFNLSHEFSVEKAALFIYLNKCGYNGMYRENSKGEFNIPFGKMNNPKIVDKITLMNIHHSLKNINIACCEYDNILEIVEKNDFVYIDPPYHNTFTDYTNNKFGETEQINLKHFIDNLSKKGVKVMLSNSATQFIKDLYNEYKQINITIKYSLGGKGADRGDKQELLILNY